MLSPPYRSSDSKFCFRSRLRSVITVINYYYSYLLPIQYNIRAVRLNTVSALCIIIILISHRIVPTIATDEVDYRRAYYYIVYNGVYMYLGIRGNAWRLNYPDPA